MTEVKKEEQKKERRERSCDISNCRRKEDKVEEVARKEDATEEGWKNTKKKELRKDTT